MIVAAIYACEWYKKPKQMLMPKTRIVYDVYNIEILVY